MGDVGFVVLPLHIVDKFISTAYVTRNADNSIRHYHVHISPPPDVVLKGYDNAPDEDIDGYFQSLN
jgi:hypothetical protein